MSSGSSDTPNPPETMGEVADKVQAQGGYTHVGPDGTVWRLAYGGEVLLSPQVSPDGIYRPFPTVGDAS
jgi:hypothetical protein